MQRGAWVGLPGVIVLVACWGEDVGPAVTFELRPFASTHLPAAMLGPTLITPDTACVVARYRATGYCVDIRGDSLVFGDAGEGPGELSGAIAAIVRGPHGDLTVTDSRLSRISRFTRNGVFVSSAPTDGTTMGLRQMTDSTALTRHRTPGDAASAYAEIHLGTGEVLRKWLPDPTVARCRTPPGPGQDKIGPAYPVGTGIVHVACFGEFLLWYPSGSGKAIVIAAPTYRERFTSEAAITKIVQARKDNASGFDPGYTVEDLRSRAYPWYGTAGGDTDDRLWIIRLNEDEGSYVDVYDLPSASFIGTAQLQGDVSMIDTRGDRLIALRRSDGLTDDVVDWYELPQERPPPQE